MTEYQNLLRSLGIKNTDVGPRVSSEEYNSVAGVQGANVLTEAFQETLKQSKTQTDKPLEVKKTSADEIWDRNSQTQKISDKTRAKNKRDQTKKAYEDYTKSDEYRQRLAENDQKAKEQQVVNLFLPPEMQQAPQVIQDDKEIRLRAAMEQAEREFNAEEDRKLMEADMEAITGLSNEERRQLEQYAVNQIRDQNMPVEFQNMPFFKTAEQEASGLIDKVGKQRADELAESYMRDQNEKFAQEVAAKGVEHAGTGFWQGAGASAATIPVNTVAGLVGSVGQLQGAARNTGRYQTLDPNATGTALQTYTGAVRGKVGQNISGDVYDEEGKLVKDGGAFRGAMALVYQGAMSIADSAARAALGRVIGTVALNATDYAGKGRLVAGMAGSALAAANSFSQTLSEASARGATPKQAITLATATSAIEALSEKIPLDELVNTAAIGKQSGKEIVSRALKQAGIELTTEEISFAASILAETAILKEKSSYKTAIVKKILEGESPEAAKLNTLREILQEAKETAIVSAISGFGSSTGSSVLGNMLADTTLNTTSPEQKTVEEVNAGTEQATVAENATVQPETQLTEQQVAPAQEQKKPDVSDVVADMVRENAAKQQEQEAAKQAVRDQAAEDQRNKQRHKDIRKELMSAKAEQNRLQKEITKAEQKLKETGKGSPARIEQLKVQLERQNNLVAQIESQEAYFSQNYEKTVEHARESQRAIYEDARQKAVQAIADHEAGRITDAQLKAANDAYNNAGAELYRLSQMTQADYQNELAQVGLVADAQTMPQSIKQPVTEKQSNTDVANIVNNMINNNRNGANNVDTVSEKSYNNSRSEQVQGAIDRLNNGGDQTPSIEEIMAIPEIAAAERANQGPETINLPNREKIREDGYQKAMQKGSWNGKDYSGEVQRNKRMDIVIGLPGSGKSSVYTERLSQENKSRVIDTDDFREYIPEYNGSNAGMVHEESSMIKDRVFEKALADGDNILLSTIGQNAKKLEAKIEAFNKLGYSVYLHLNELPNNKSLARAISRYLPEKGGTARYVSPELIASYGDLPTQTYLYLTGQGGNENGRLGRDLRQSGGPDSGNAEQTGSAAGSKSGLLAGYDWYNNDVNRGEPPRLIQTSEQSAPTADTQRQSAMGGQSETVGKQNTPSGDIEQSKTFTNTGRRSPDADIRKGYRDTMRSDRNAANYEVKHNVDTLATAQERTQTPDQAREEADYLVNKDYRDWTAEDNVTALLTIQRLTQEGGEGAAKLIASVAAQRKQANVHAGQLAQSNRIIGTMKAADNTVTAVDTFISSMESMKEGQTTYNKKSGKDFETWKQDIETTVTEIGIAIESVEEGNAGEMRNIIRQIARERKTTAWFGTSDQLTPEANKILNKLDYDTLKKIANTQVAAMADDYRKRTKKEVATTLRKQSMLSSLKTIARNVTGNTVGGVADALSESGAGRLADMAMAKFTGKKTVGSDVFQAKEYARAAKEAGQFASLCVELNIPIETDVDSSFAAAAGNESNEKYIGRTFRSTGNPAMRFLYAYQKYMSYSLEVTDKVFEGGTNAAVEASLKNLKNSNLTDEDVERLSDFTAQKRTFKNATWKDADGETHGSKLSRVAAQIQNVPFIGDAAQIAAPFVSTPMNVAETGIDYTAGVVRGLGDMISVIRDAKAGKDIPVERQRQAASEFGRGLTGAAMIAMFASAAAMGALRVSNAKDWDEEALAKAEGRSGAQFNWDAWLRGLQGGDGKWQTGDVVSSVDFLEPFNTQMYLGYEIAEFNKEAGEDATWQEKAKEYGKASAKSVFNSLMDSPVMTGLQEISDLIDDIKEADGNMGDIGNAIAAYGGDVASSYIPQVVRQTAQHTDGYYRDTKGKTPAETAVNSIKAAIPGLSQTLPKKYSGLGEAQKRGGWLETFVDPTATFTYEENKVTTYLDDLSKRTGDASIYPSKQAPMRIEVADEIIELDPQQREKYQKTYGEKANALYSQMIAHSDFEKLPDELKNEAFKEAEVYARKTAMAAVSEYKDAPKAQTGKLVADAIADTVRTAINGQFTAVDTAREYGRGTDEAAAKMEEFYQVFADLSRTSKQNVENSATGDTAKYLEVRQNGATTKQFLSATAAIDKLKPEAGYTTVRDIQTRGAIADLPGVSNGVKDILMKAYMADYDPNAKTVQKTELKYDYARQEIGLSPSGYVEAYRVSLDGGKKYEKIAAWREMGYTWQEANLLYRLFDATGRTKIDVEKWHNSK